jgi:AraC-like DNA-binding protein
MHETSQYLHKSPRTPLRLLAAGSHEATQGQHFPAHCHVSWELVYYRSGHIHCPVGDEMYESQPGMFLLTPPHIRHAEYAETAYSNYFIAIEASADQAWPRMCMDTPEHVFGNLCAALVREWNRPDIDQEVMLASLVNQLDILLRRVQKEPHISEEERLVRSVEQLLRERFSRPLRIGDIAQEVGVSCSHLRSQFTRLRGQSPLSYLQDIRVQHAITLLRTSSSSLSTIAVLCGYDSASHLSRHIKRVSGKSPGALRYSI